MQCKSDTEVIQMSYKPDQIAISTALAHFIFLLRCAMNHWPQSATSPLGLIWARSPTHKIQTDMQNVNFPERNGTLTGHHSFCEIKKLGHIVINLLITGWRTECGLLKKSWLGKSLAIDSSKLGADHTPSSSSFINKLVTMWSSVLISQNEW